MADLINMFPDMSTLGCCGKWVNEALDFAISHNKWPVRFKTQDDKMADMVPEFTLCMWLGYVAKMRGHPAPSAKSSQLVLKYLILNADKVVKAWRNRIYRYLYQANSSCVVEDRSNDTHVYIGTLLELCSKP